MEQKVVARMEFTADGLLPKMKKALEKKRGTIYAEHPAIELATGIMLATEGHILVAHKLKDYSYEQQDDAELQSCIMLPASVLQMTGRVSVEVSNGCGEIITIATDEQGATDTCTWGDGCRYPAWRSAMPSAVGAGIAVNAKEWEKAAKDVTAKNATHTTAQDSLTIYGNEGGGALTIATYYDGTEAQELDRSVTVNVGEVPFPLRVWFNAKHFRAVMSFRPTEMMFVGSNRGTLFKAADTLLLLMPLWEDNACVVSATTPFNLEAWIGGEAPKAKPTPKPKTQAKSEPTLAEILTAALAKLKAEKVA